MAQVSEALAFPKFYRFLDDYPKENIKLKNYFPRQKIIYFDSSQD